MKIVENNNQNTVIARTVQVGAVFVHQGSFHMRVSDPYVRGWHFPAVELATGRYVLISNVIDVILRPDVHMVSGYPACDPACDAGTISSEEAEFYDDNYLGVGLQE